MSNVMLVLYDSKGKLREFHVTCCREGRTGILADLASLTL